MLYVLFFFFNDTATTEIYTLSLHDALPIFTGKREYDPAPTTTLEGYIFADASRSLRGPARCACVIPILRLDRKSTRLNSSHANISYAVFCLKKKKTKKI